MVRLGGSLTSGIEFMVSHLSFKTVVLHGLVEAARSFLQKDSWRPALSPKTTFVRFCTQIRQNSRL